MAHPALNRLFTVPSRPLGAIYPDVDVSRLRALDSIAAPSTLSLVGGHDWMRRVSASPATPRTNVVHTFANRAAFNALASAGTGAGAAGMPEVKFLIDRQTHQLYFIPPEFPYHYDFATRVLGVRASIEEFNRIAYVDPNRRYIAGTIDAYDNYEATPGTKGIFGLSFWSTDVVHGSLILEAQSLIADAMKFSNNGLVYHPLGQSQERELEKNNAADKKALEAAHVGILSNAELTKNFSFMSLNNGKSYGVLRFVQDASNETLTRRDIAIFAGDPPATLPPLAGLATSRPQTFLSHDALKARQDKTPYAYARDILKDPAVRALEGKVVEFEVTPNGYKIKAAKQQQANDYFESLRPKTTQVLKPNLSVRAIKSLDEITFADRRAYGTKTTNVAELHRLHVDGLLAVNDPRDDEPEIIAPDGFGIPARMYYDFMKKAKYDDHQTFAQRLEKMIADADFKSSPEQRKKMLKDFQDKMEDAEMPASLKSQADALAVRFKEKFPNENMRIRSSSDSEDLEGFNGAGLFDSYTFRWDEADKKNRDLYGRLRKVFSSVWNDRAYSEFDFYRIKPSSVDMAELIAPNSEGEIANGVVRWGGAIPGWDTITINAQVREKLVTNPEGGEFPDAIVVGNYGFSGEPEIQYEAHTNQELVQGRTSVLTDGEIRSLFKAMKVIQGHFAKLYGKENDPNFSIECEFKITAEGKLLIKQARPWVG